MAATDATTFPVYGQAYRIPVEFRDTANNLITLTWTALTVVMVGDGVINGGLAAFPNVPVQYTGAAVGFGYLDIPAAYMAFQMVQIAMSETALGPTGLSPVPSTAIIQPLRLFEKLTAGKGGWDVQNQLLFEDIILNVVAVCRNAISQPVGANTTQTVSEINSTTPYLVGTVSQTNTGPALRGKLS